MRARDGVEEDLSAYAREDLVYKAKLAEQAERCARMNRSNRSARVGKEWDGRRRRDDGRVSRRRWRATRGGDRTRTTARARARRPRARSIERVARRVESSRIDSIDRSNERPNEWAPIERTNDRCATRDARRRARCSRSSTCARVVGGEGGGERAMKGGSTRPRVPARIEGAGRARARGGGNARPNRSGVRREATDGGACD